MENSTGGKGQRRKWKVLKVNYYMPEGYMCCLASEHCVLKYILWMKRKMQKNYFKKKAYLRYKNIAREDNYKDYSMNLKDCNILIRKARGENERKSSYKVRQL